MNRRTRLHRPVSRLCLPLVLGITLGAAAADKPNFVYVMADELGYYELSCLGNPHIQTPVLDRLAAEGIRFTQGLAGSSVCAPTRACLMTGKHSGHTSVRSNGGGTPLRAEEATVASVLKAAGYATGGFGKWGCGGRGSTGVPEKHGFDVFFGYYDQVHAHSYYPPYLIRNSQEVPLPGNHGLSDGTTYSHNVIFQAALDFIRTHRNSPFLCYLPVTPPHGIFDIPDDDPAWALYRGQDWPEPAKRYAAMVTMLDRQVGELVALLTGLGLRDKTLLVFSGDNGGADYFRDAEHPRGFHGANVDPRTGVAFRGRKGQLYEGGLRIPAFANWPGRIRPGQVSDLLWYFPDILPTFADLAGATVPADIDGISLAPTLLGADVAGRPQAQHDYLYWEIGNQIAVREGLWKAIQPGKNRPWELYDLGRDPSEAQDLAAAEPETLARLRSHATAAHEPVREGTFFDRSPHERDRRAKFGAPNTPRTTGRTTPWSTQGLIPPARFRLVRVCSQATGNHREVEHAWDSDPRTHWHTRFSPTLDRPPHELVLDLGGPCRVRGLRYLARQDGGWNGTFKDCRITVSDDPEAFGPPQATVTLHKTKQVQEVPVAPAVGRYLRIEILTEINNGPWASAAEIGVVGTCR